MSSLTTSYLPPAVIVYHESARAIVFRDHIRRQHSIIKQRKDSGDEDERSNGSLDEMSEKIANYTPEIDPLPKLDFGADDEFEPLLRTEDEENDVVKRLREERCVVKTVRNADWTKFLEKLKESEEGDGQGFYSSSSLLPSLGEKMRCFGSFREYTTGVIFALPDFDSPQSEQEAIDVSKTWCWPSGYSAKTEFNIDRRGNLINGRQEALVSMEKLRSLNNDYLTKDSYEIAGRVIEGGLNTVPYNEVYIRIGSSSSTPNFQTGVGRPIGLFCRTAQYGHLIHMLRTRARYCSTFSLSYDSMPMFVISSELGIKTFSPGLQKEFWHAVASQLNPFQNSTISHRTTVDTSNPVAMQQKLQELINLDELGDAQLTREECAKIAGGFGATDDSVAKMLMNAVQEDGQETLQSVVNEGLTAAVRSGDYHTSRQLLILYTLISSKKRKEDKEIKLLPAAENESLESNDLQEGTKKLVTLEEPQKVHPQEMERITEEVKKGELSEEELVDYSPPPPPPPLDTDRLRSATNSDGLLAVLGAAEVLKAMQDGSAKKRVSEVILALDEWVEEGEQNLAFRLASWHNQRLAQGDLQIATGKDSNFAAFIGTKAISNRRKFATDLREAMKSSGNFFETVKFLEMIHKILSKMHSPCLRLELLQYVLGLDNRYSAAHVTRSVELAATCLNISSGVEEE